MKKKKKKKENGHIFCRLDIGYSLGTSCSLILNFEDNFLYLVWQLVSFESTILRNSLRVAQILKGEKLKKWGRNIKGGLDPSAHYEFKAIRKFTRE